MAQRAETAPFKPESLRAALSEVRRLTRRPPEYFQPRLTGLLAQCGVVFVVVPHLKRTGAHRATRWLTSDKALVQMSIRYGWDDIFWFSRFHELGHVLLHGRDSVFIEDHRRGTEEDEADEFAMNVLIPAKAHEAFVRRADFSAITIRRFAARQGIAPSIVVGRLQRNGHVDHSALNELRGRFTLAA